MNDDIEIKNEPLEEDWTLVGARQESEEKDKNINNECKNMINKEIVVNSSLEEYMKMWKQIYPLVDRDKQRTIYENNSGNIRQTMAEMQQLNKQFEAQNLFKCNQCTKTFKKNENVTVHSRTHTGEKPYQCGHCEKAFKQKSELKYMKMWKQIYPLVDREKQRTIYENNSGNIRKTMVEMQQLNKQIEAQNLYKCNQCKKSFKKKEHFTVHSRTHTGEKAYQCGHCEKPFKQKSELTSHIKTHTGEKPYHCSHCEKAFKQKGGLIYHLKTQTGEKPYQCSHCEWNFKQKSGLTSHLRIHTGEKPYKCSHCEKSFKQKYHLTAHARTHSVGKP